jgi:hypothetical protein
MPDDQESLQVLTIKAVKALLRTIGTETSHAVNGVENGTKGSYAATALRELMTIGWAASIVSDARLDEQQQR